MGQRGHWGHTVGLCPYLFESNVSRSFVFGILCVDVRTHSSVYVSGRVNGCMCAEACLCGGVRCSETGGRVEKEGLRRSHREEDEWRWRRKKRRGAVQ